MDLSKLLSLPISKQNIGIMTTIRVAVVFLLKLMKQDMEKKSMSQNGDGLEKTCGITSKFKLVCQKLITILGPYMICTIGVM